MNTTVPTADARKANDTILVINAGSSSVKFALFQAGTPAGGHAMLRGQVEDIGEKPRLIVRRRDGSIAAEEMLAAGSKAEPCLAFLLDWLRRQFDRHRLIGAGHRVVHGGEDHAAPVLIDTQVMAALEALIPLARTHEPHELAAIKAVAAINPGLPQVACFDTAFHATQPEVARRFGLPRALHDAGVRRYGFHGLSFDYIAGVLPRHLGPMADKKVIVAHLGGGASLCAMLGRKSVATTMGFTTLDGLLMGTRPGSLDPGVLLYLIQERGMSPKEVNDMLYNRSGLLGVSGISGDMRVLLASTNPRAKEAVDLFVYRATMELGALAAVLGGLDALVFTGGIGEHAHPVRAMICDRARWLGVELDAAANRGDQVIISTPESRVAVSVIPTNEEITIARHTQRLLETAASVI
jgi:acetate kinase